MLKYIWKSLKIDEIRSEIVRYGLQCSEKLEISKSVKKSLKMKVVPMGWPGVENVPAPRESILTLSRGSQLPYTKNHLFFLIKTSIYFLDENTLFFFVYGSWEPLDSVKILSRGVGTFSTPGEPVGTTFIF